MAHHPDNAGGWYEANEIVCHACAAREIHAEKNSSPAPGTNLAVDYVRPKNKPLGSWTASKKDPATPGPSQTR